VGEAAGLDRSLLEPSYRVLSEFGNMSSPTVLFILDRLRYAAAARPCAALAFGPGLAAEAALFR
jgi:predicted naringenin-chalcone synthase